MRRIIRKVREVDSGSGLKRHEDHNIFYIKMTRMASIFLIWSLSCMKEKFM